MSQHLVSTIELLGLIIGLLGFFYLALATDLFSGKGSRFILPLLPGIAAGLFAIPLVAIQVSLPLSSILPTDRGNDNPATVITAAMILFVSGYFYGYMFSSAWRRDLRFVVFLVVVVAPLSGAIGGAIPFYINMHPSMVDTLLVAGTYFVFFLVNAALDILPALLKGRNQIVRNIGIIATILAILAQFLPPVLDLLNIPITKP